MMTKQTEALKMAIEWIEGWKGIAPSKIELLRVLIEALEQPSVAELNNEYLRDTHVEGLQPAQEPYDLVAILNDPMQAYPANFTTAKKGNALLFGLCQEAADEIQRLQHKTLEQPAQKPVAWCDSLVSPKTFATNIQQRCPIPLYTHPAPSWQGLSEEEMMKLANKYIDLLPNGEIFHFDLFAHAIEQALKEKNT